MTSTEVRIAIADYRGWLNIHESGRLDGQLVGYPPNGLLQAQEIPPVDLNEMHEAENILRNSTLLPSDPKSKTWLYLLKISEVTNAKYESGPWTICNASAEARAEALLRTIGKWKD